MSTIPITEVVLDPPPVVPRHGVSYRATYRLQDQDVEIRLDIMSPSYQMLSVSLEDGPIWRQFSSMYPPFVLFEPAFASWLQQFMDDAMQRWTARTQDAAGVA